MVHQTAAFVPPPQVESSRSNREHLPQHTHTIFCLVLLVQKFANKKIDRTDLASTGLRSHKPVTVTVTPTAAYVTSGNNETSEFYAPNMSHWSLTTVQTCKYFHTYNRLMTSSIRRIRAAFSSKYFRQSLQSLARLLIYRVRDQQETEELSGIHQVTGTEVYLLVAFNVLLVCWWAPVVEVCEFPISKENGGLCIFVHYIGDWI